MDKKSKIYIAGHRGLVGNAILKELKYQGYENIIFKTHKELDLTNKLEVENFFKEEKPEYVFLAAAKVGGIQANKNFPVEFLYQNLEIQNNVIMAAYKYKVKKLMFLGSSCIYPKFCPQPMKEEYLLTGELEVTNEAYSIAKIAGLKLCEYLRREYGADFISVMPTNIYGPNDNFDVETSHVIPSLIRRIHEAKIKNIPEVIIWGSGSTKREFMYVDDLAKAIVFVMKNYSKDKFINIGTGVDITINELANLIKEIIGYEGKLINDISKPDGTPQKLLEVSKLKEIGWQYKVELREGLEKTYKWYLENK
ncbi:GDP-L-fucose synthase [uncultured Fusobacterium sp.]|uniref:GDP-L-fucose synthase family protein n=1 Tax=uncultured Fusobacterium sp. TaxID=159267 RepID=UPI0025FC8D41|nr:GDP-L-fucose synthase [uncultured Fusobacterium sp.]